jgi:hypothetical protein
MKKNMKLFFLLLWIIAASAFSCKKNEDKNVPAKTKTELLTTGTWKRTALISTPAYDWYGDGTFATDILSVMKPCEKDNIDTYKTNGVFETDEAATKCDPADPQTWTASWVFADNETKLIFDGTDEYTLDELTETTLKFHSTFVENGVTYTQVETYGH